MNHEFLAPSPDRLDRLIAAQVPDLSRSQAQRLVETGRVSVDGAIVSKPAYTVAAGARVIVDVPAPAPATAVAEDIPLDIIYEDDDVIVVNKAAGMVVHPAVGHATGTLVNAVLGHDPDLEGVGDEARPGIVHRLDKDTSGLILIAKNDRAHRDLQAKFADRRITKVYQALVDNWPQTDTGRIEAAIGRDPRDRQRMAIVPAAKGRMAITEYKVLEKFENRGRGRHSWVEVNLLTGRTHQIRVHFAYLKCPIVGDTVYGHAKPSLPVGRQCLHAARLTLALPGKRTPVTFEAPLPTDIEHLFESLRG